MNYVASIRNPLNLASYGARRLTGVDEDVLDQVPSERARYTSMGLTIIGTAVMAGVGMFVLLGLMPVSETPRLLLASAWALFILVIDYSIVSRYEDSVVGVLNGDSYPNSVHPLSGGRSRWLVRFGVRLVLASVLALVVAESIVLAVFSEEAEGFLDDRTEIDLLTSVCIATSNARASVLEYEVELSECSGVEVPAEVDQVDAIPESAAITAAEQELALLTARRERLVPESALLQEDLELWQDRALCERNPSFFDEEQQASLGCSGSAGNGPAAVAAETRAAVAEEELREVDQKLADLQSAIDEQRATRAEAINDATAVLTATNDQLVAAAEQSILVLEQHRSGDFSLNYGLSDRFVAVEEVVPGVLRWGLRLLLVLVDLTPILIKATSGGSATEAIMTIRRQAALVAVATSLAMPSSTADLRAEVAARVTPQPETDGRPPFFVVPSEVLGPVEMQDSIEALTTDLATAGIPASATSSYETGPDGLQGVSIALDRRRYLKAEQYEEFWSLHWTSPIGWNDFAKAAKKVGGDLIALQSPSGLKGPFDFEDLPKILKTDEVDVARVEDNDNDRAFVWRRIEGSEWSQIGLSSGYLQLSLSVDDIIELTMELDDSVLSIWDEFVLRRLVSYIALDGERLDVHK